MAIPVWTECTQPQVQTVILFGPWMPMGVEVQLWAECDTTATTFTKCSAPAPPYTEKSKVTPTWTENSV